MIIFSRDFIYQLIPKSIPCIFLSVSMIISSFILYALFVSRHLHSIALNVLLVKCLHKFAICLDVRQLILSRGYQIFLCAQKNSFMLTGLVTWHAIFTIIVPDDLVRMICIRDAKVDNGQRFQRFQRFVCEQKNWFVDATSSRFH